MSNNSLFVKETIEKLDVNNCYNKTINLFSSGSQILENCMKKCFKVDIWESYMKVYYVKDTIFNYYNDSTLRWIFFRISFNTYTELIEYFLNYSIDNEKYSKLSLKNQQDFYRLFNIFFKTIEKTKHEEVKNLLILIFIK